MYFFFKLIKINNDYWCYSAIKKKKLTDIPF